VSHAKQFHNRRYFDDHGVADDQALRALLGAVSRPADHELLLGAESARLRPFCLAIDTAFWYLE
jgi:hypothetical protein